MTLRTLAGQLRSEFLAHVRRRDVELNGRGPFVSFTFDDFPRTALTAGGAILDAYGIRATFYAAMGLRGVTNELGPHFVDDDLAAVLERGHELGNHTFSHLSARRVSLRAFAADAELGRIALREVAGSACASGFAYPYGHATPASKAKLDEVASSCRGTYPGLNGPAADLRLLRANPLFGGAEQYETARKLIDLNRETRAWLIFYTHDVSPQPSPFGCTPELLEAVVGAAVESSAVILPVGEVLAHLA